jgi:hypothetical protein
MAGALTVDTLNSGTGVLATQNGMTGIAKAWVNCSGTTINGSFNVSSITLPATGRFQINYTTALPNANSVVVASGAPATDIVLSCFTALQSSWGTNSTTACFISTVNVNAIVMTAPVNLYVVVFGS